MLPSRIDAVQVRLEYRSCPSIIHGLAGAALMGSIAFSSHSDNRKDAY